MMNYLKKMKGTAQGPPGPGAGEIVWSWLGAFLGISLTLPMVARDYYDSASKGSKP